MLKKSIVGLPLLPNADECPRGLKRDGLFLPRNARKLSPSATSLPALSFLLSATAIYTLLASGLADRIALDRPNNRSAHILPVPRSGGVGVMFAVLICSVFVRSDLEILVLLSAVLSSLSLWDDRNGLPVLARLLVHVLASVVFIGHISAVGWATAGLMIILLVWVTNLFNFMDGADGLAGGMAVIGFGFLGWGTLLGNRESEAVVCFIVAAAALGFLIFNFSPARIFLGDVGSIPLGYLAGGIGLYGWHKGMWPAVFPCLVFSPFLFDATVTLLRRLSRGEHILSPHREHYYQRLLRMGWRHRQISLAYYALMFAGGIAAIASLGSAKSLWISLLVMASIHVGAAWWVDKCWRKSYSAEMRSVSDTGH